MPQRLRLAVLTLGFIAIAAVATLLITPARVALAQGDPPSASLELVAEGLTQPVALVEAPDESGRLFIVDQTGQIWIKPADGEILTEPFLDISDRMVALNPGYDERGLLGLAFHPDYATNGRFFLYYSVPLRDSAPDDFNHTSRISEFEVSASDPNVANDGSERVLLEVDKPQSNHNGGTVAFGPDGFLYISLGDGGGADDVGLGHVDDWYETNEGGNGQDVTQNLLGSILRIDVDSGDPYSIPEDNPFVGSKAGFTEQYAYGFRNPYRFSFDIGGENELFVADAGQNLYEEVSIVENGGNYGWNVKEGTHCFSTANPDVSLADCPDTDPDGEPLIDPIIEYSHEEGGLVVVGAYVYRGTEIPDWDGVLIFGDWSADFDNPGGTIFAATPPATGSGLWSWQKVSLVGQPDNSLPHYLLGLGQDNSGELYALTTDSAGPAGTTGRVYQIVPANPTAVTLAGLETTTSNWTAGAFALAGLALTTGLLMVARRRRTGQ